MFTKALNLPSLVHSLVLFILTINELAVVLFSNFQGYAEKNKPDQC